MKQVLVSWIGGHDLKASSRGELGAIASIALQAQIPFKEIQLLVSNWEEEIDSYKSWLHSQLVENDRKAIIDTSSAEIFSPINYHEIYTEVDQVLAKLFSSGSKVTINLTSGTPQ